MSPYSCSTLGSDVALTLECERVVPFQKKRKRREKLHEPSFEPWLRSRLSDFFAAEAVVNSDSASIRAGVDVLCTTLIDQYLIGFDGGDSALSLVLSYERLGVHDAHQSPFRALHFSDEWREFLRSFPLTSKNTSIDLAPFSVLFCGRKDVGKSTHARSLINRILSAQRSLGHENTSADDSERGVLFLDLDPGQGEFHLPGLLSLHLVRCPLVGSPHARAKRASTEPSADFRTLSLELLGSTSPKNCPLQFSRCVSRLARLRNSYPNLPIVINTCGWTHGRGASLLLHSARETQAGQIVHLIAPQQHAAKFDTSPFQGLESVVFHSFLSVTYGSSASESIDVFPSISSPPAIISNSYASHSRVLMWRSVVLSAPSTWIALSSYELRGLESISSSHRISALNSSIIAFVDTTMSSLLGLALVRAIDLTFSRLLVQTSLSRSALERATTIVATQLELAVELLLSQSTRRSNQGSNSGVDMPSYQCSHVLSQYSGLARTFVERAKYLDQ